MRNRTKKVVSKPNLRRTLKLEKPPGDLLLHRWWRVVVRVQVVAVSDQEPDTGGDEGEGLAFCDRQLRRFETDGDGVGGCEGHGMKSGGCGWRERLSPMHLIWHRSAQGAIGISTQLA